MPVNWSFILNPVAGAGRLQRRWPAMRAELKKGGLMFDEYWTTRSKEAVELAKKLVENGQRHIIGVGGDGTNNEIINGIMSQSVVPTQQVYYSLLPFGTGNDWVRTHQIPHSISDWLKMIDQHYTIKHDIGWVDCQTDKEVLKRYFVNVAGFAYDAHIVKKAEEYDHTKKKKILYFWLVIKELWGYKTPKLKIHFDDIDLIDNYYTINVGICKYSGGGMQLVAHANPKDGQLALTIIKDFPKWKVILDTPKLFTGNLSQHKYSALHHTKNLSIQAVANHKCIVEVDGEYIGDGATKIGILPAAINVIVPKK